MPNVLKILVTWLLWIGATAGGQERIALQGDVIGVHDPAVAKEGNRWYVFSTGSAPGGGQLPIRCSEDLRQWRMCGEVFRAMPNWIRRASPATKDLWAPDISYEGGEYRVYYAYSVFGKRTSGIGLATNETLDPNSSRYRWVDRGVVLKSSEADDYNAIDPNFVRDAQNRFWLVFGSFWGGIKMLRLNERGFPAEQPPRLYSVAYRPEANHAIEAPFVVHHGRYYYLFVSMDICCRGAQSTYRVAIGRSKQVSGPYVDRQGRPMTEGGGTELLKGNQAWAGPGGESVWRSPKLDLLVFHAYDSMTGKPALQISKFTWKKGWPTATLSP